MAKSHGGSSSYIFFSFPNGEKTKDTCMSRPNLDFDRPKNSWNNSLYLLREVLKHLVIY